jgi:hypothetical protein
MSVYSNVAAAYERRERREQGLVHLQFVGDLPGTPARDLEAGDKLMWNGGDVYVVLSVREVSAQFIEITETAASGSKWEDGKEYPRRLKKDRLVVRVCRECHWVKHRPSCTQASPR